MDRGVGMKKVRTVSNQIIRFSILLLISVIFLLNPMNLFAKNQQQSSKSKKSAVASVSKKGESGYATPKRSLAGLSDSEKALEIRGQARNLSMMLVLKNRKENIDFVHPRESYKSEVQATGF